MRRILLVLTVALVMAAMMVVMAAPAFARNGPPFSNSGHDPTFRSAIVYHCQYFGYDAGAQASTSGNSGTQFNCR